VTLLGHKGKPKSWALLLAKNHHQQQQEKTKESGTTPTTRIARCPRGIYHLSAAAGPSIVLTRTKMEEQPSQDIPHGGQESERIMHPPEEENPQEPFQRLHSSQDRLLQLRFQWIVSTEQLFIQSHTLSLHSLPITFIYVLVLV